jgi:hypothetical protein
MPCTFVDLTFPSRTTRTHNKHPYLALPLYSTSLSNHFNYLSMSFLPKSLDNELQPLIELNRIENQVPSVKVEQKNIKILLLINKKPMEEEKAKL